MFSLMSNCCSWVSRVQRPVRKVTVLVVGLDKAGKSLYVRGMSRAPLGDMGPTRGCVRNELKVENVVVNLLDVGGGPEARASWREYYTEAHGFIFVVDSSDRQRMKEVKDLLRDMLRHPSVAGKPLLVLANKQDKMNALLGSELIEVLSLEKLVNQSQSLCHIESCSALMDLRRRSDRKTQRGVRWLLQAVCSDYSELCARVIRDVARPPGPENREQRRKGEKRRKKNKDDRVKASTTEFSHEQDELEKESNGTSPQPNGNVSEMESSFRTKLKSKKKVKIKSVKRENKEEGEHEEEDGDGNKAGRLDHTQKEKTGSALLPRRHGKLKRRVKVKEEPSDHSGSLTNDDQCLTNDDCTPANATLSPLIPARKEQEKNNKKKVVKGKRRNKINTEKILAAYSQPSDLSATFDLYRKAILALKARQDQGLVPVREETG
ncbi:ADP-ribosylation factor-like protein 13A [Brachyhypopomus gauderio]|uniref:ADP-ribosylation factor-like protein 13A n=1 Tax=Brachyhypopomus gauderio TaxID=698409 RepID=UPI00404350B3